MAVSGIAHMEDRDLTQALLDSPSSHAIVVTGSGCGGGNAKSMLPSRCTVQQPATGSQKYSSSVRPVSRGRS